MSATPAETHGHAAHDHDHDAHHGHEEPHGSFKGYMIGFILSVILTAIPFALVMTGALDKNSTVVAIFAMAVVQIFVHMVYFLHMNTKTEGGWSMLALIFTIVFVLITLAGSIWVMYHMNTNMMPMTPRQAAAQFGG
ncbi:cytochrome o ubiquinol oxidase subunit IV [Stakelama sp. CBK3Z-3]|uniref:Cytochrome bo(3) ubiquinol oxidase subunit 4 n=1 Tax=Stakelama flava TaxID=2860338 RepID=A0ABS6XN22_9SPHN|nr:cytochrome o ubiquinol oxidase subunit IV [Stakelama flava]MBW4331600.1 cytochrome o ubiquinol oxidase subunit IV [Stakelama flava]